MRLTASALGGAMLAMVTVLATALPAHAAQSPNWMSCSPVTGQLTGLTVDSNGSAMAEGLISPCHTPINIPDGHVEVFAIARYTSSSASSWRTAFPPEAGAFRAYPNLGVIANSAQAEAICLISSESVRLDCMQISWVTRSDGRLVPVAGAHIPITAPLVNRKADPAPGDFDGPDYGDPTCPTCGDGSDNT